MMNRKNPNLFWQSNVLFVFCSILVKYAAMIKLSPLTEIQLLSSVFDSLTNPMD